MSSRPRIPHRSRVSVRPETAGGERQVSGIESRPLRSLNGGLLVTAVAVRGAGGQLTVKAVRLPAALRHW
jgi:hypothetical protein